MQVIQLIHAHTVPHDIYRILDILFHILSLNPIFMQLLTATKTEVSSQRPVRKMERRRFSIKRTPSFLSTSQKI